MTEGGENFKDAVLSFPRCLLWKAEEMIAPSYGCWEEYSQRHLGESRADRESSRLNMTSRLNWGERKRGHMAAMTDLYRNQKLGEGKPKGWRLLG